MKTILFPTDFSECADNALNYAIALSKRFNAKIVIHNSCHVSVFSEQVPFQSITEEQVYSDANVDMKDYIQRNSSKLDKVNFESNVSMGLAGDNIVTVAKEVKADLIVMGTKGTSRLERVLIGSNSSSVIEKAECPVLTVPIHASYSDIRKIVFATDYNDNDISSISFLAELAMPYMAEILIVHVSPITGTDALEKDRFNMFKEEVRKRIHYENISFQLAIGLNLASDLDTIVEEQDADMLSMTMRKRSFVNKFFSPSLTKEIKYHTRVPLLCFHNS